MSLYQLTVVSVLCLSSVLAKLAWDDPCNNISPNYHGNGIEAADYVLNFTHECPEGMIRWSYPRGTFQINFAPVNKVSFQICLKTGSANFIHEIFSLEHGKRVPVTIPTEGTDSCIQSHDNQVQLILVGPPELYYVTFIDFETKLS